MNSAISIESEDVLSELVHDLRQPLGTLEYSTSYLRLLLGETQGAVEQQLRVIQQQLDLAARLVSEAVARATRAEGQRAGDGASRDLTKSETAALT